MIIIEHLEPKLSEWLLLEYKHCTKYDKIIFTNVKSKVDAKKLSKFGDVLKESVTKSNFDKKKILILDPRTKKSLTKKDLKKYPFVIIGGILGEAKPKGRTKKFITEKMKSVAVRNIGKEQFSIDGTAVVLNAIKKGLEYEVLENPEIKLSANHFVTLHYAVPKIKGKIVLTPGLLAYLKEA